MARSSDRVRRTRQVTLLLLVVAIAQVLWWELDQVRYARSVEDFRLEALKRDRAAAQDLLELGTAEAAIESRWPHLRIQAGEVRVREEARQRLSSERRAHVNQYQWEGGFFLVVLLAGGIVVGRVLRQEAALRRRQQNFLASVSHELKSPLASVQLATETMLRRELDEDRRRELMSRSLRDLDRLGSMIGNLLQVPRLESGRMELLRQQVMLAETVDQVLDGLRRAGWNGASAVRRRIGDETAVIADPIGVETVIRNLVENALVATGGDGDAITITASEDERRVRLEIADTGTGFDPAERKLLFEKFYRPGDELRRRTSGTGLGLYIVARFLALEGGGVEASSPGPGEGARFEVWWPRRRPSPDESPWTAEDE